MKTRMNRRNLLLGGAAGAGIGAAGYGAIVAAGAAQSCPTGDPLALDVDAALLRIGRRYLATAGLAERRRLRALAAKSAAGGRPSLHMASAALGGGASGDFAQGDVVLCDGWMLGRNEARACALLALTAAAA